MLDGKVISAPTVNSAIPNGQAEISGNFTQKSGADAGQQPEVRRAAAEVQGARRQTDEGPTLAADQLSAGLLAGAIGLALVLLYCLLYYRGLGLVVVASLVIAGAITYAVGAG